MACYYPLKAWRGRKAGASGKVAIVFNSEDSCGVAVELPCGRCIGCRLERSRQWAVRCMHEASLHDSNSFVTLTYDEDCVPSDGSLNKRHWQLFAKRLRKRFGSFRFFHCGEYGERLSRPHYHAILFGMDFPDKVVYSRSNDITTYESRSLDETWGLGHCLIGSVTFDSCAYVARYIVKKVTGDPAEDHYGGKLPEYSTMSRRPGIAREWFRKFGDEVFPADEVISRGYSSRPPRYYDNLIEEAEPSVFDVVKRKRKALALSRAADSTPARLKVREKVAKARLSLVRRKLES